MHWLGSERLRQYVRKAVKKIPNTGSWPITAMTWHLLYTDGVVHSAQAYPTHEDVQVALYCLMQQGYVERYCDRATGGIRYRLRAYRR